MNTGVRASDGADRNGSSGPAVRTNETNARTTASSSDLERTRGPSKCVCNASAVTCYGVRVRCLIERVVSADESTAVCLSVCRICLQADLDESNKCISPCFCRGTMSKVHKACLETWLAQSDSDDCEICKFKYKTKRITKYSILGSIRMWLIDDDRREEIEELLCDAWLLLMIFPILFLLTYLTLYIINYISDQGPKLNVLYQIASFCAGSTIMCADFFFTFWICIKTQHHVLRWLAFYKSNQQVTIVDTKFRENSS